MPTARNWLKLQTSNLKRKFPGSVGRSPLKNFCGKGVWWASRDLKVCGH